MKQFNPRAPFGIVVLQLDNGDEALYVNGEFIQRGENDGHYSRTVASGRNLATALSLPFYLLNARAPSSEELLWDDVTASLGWTTDVRMSRRIITPVLKCSLAHITKEDNALLTELCHSEYESEWIHEADLGYIINVDAVRSPVLMLKKHGLSRDARWLIQYAIKQANISMIHFTQWGEPLDGIPTFDW